MLTRKKDRWIETVLPRRNDRKREKEREKLLRVFDIIQIVDVSLWHRKKFVKFKGAFTS